MKRLYILLFFLAPVFVSNGYSQDSLKITKRLQNIIKTSSKENYSVFIFFTDKGENLSKKIIDAENLLPANAIKRRKKLMKNKPSLATIYDIPINENYFLETKKYISKLRHRLKWLNAISAEVSKQNIDKIAQLQFVKKIDIVRKGKVTRKQTTVDFSRNIAYNPFHKTITNSKYNMNYGASLTQLEQMNVPAVHDMGYDASGVIICVMDAGFNNLEHPSFSDMQSNNRILGTWDFVNNDANVDDEDDDMGTGDHGTMTLSTIGGFKEGELIGPAYKANYVLTKTENTDSETTVEEDNWVAAVQWAEDNYGPDVTSTSLGYIDFDNGTGYDASELDGNTATITIGADIAASLGILVVNSAGNEGSGVTTIGAPADGDSVLAVGAVYDSGDRTSFSSVGPTGDGRIKPDVMAMGSGVTVAQSGSGTGYTTADGTSFSCPLTAGGAALLVQMLPNASNMDIIEAMKMTADNSSSPNNEYGWGIINIKAAYEYFAPQIIHNPLNDTENYAGPYTVNVQINSLSDLVAGAQKLYWRRNGGSWQTVTMNLSKENGTFSADIPGNGAVANYDYYIKAENETLSRTLPENAPTSYFSFSTIVDNTAPAVNHTSIKEYYISMFASAKINAEMTDNTGINLQTSHVEWKINDVAQENFNFIRIVDDNYSAAFPSANINIGDIIKYKIVAKDNANSTHITNFPTSGYFEFAITDRISFEQNQFSHNWTFSGDANWTVTNTESQDGSYCAKSGDIDDSQTSEISISFTTSENGQVSFYKKVSCEDDSFDDDYDYLKFSIDGNEQERWDGEVAWSQENYNLTQGQHTISWLYNKDSYVSEGADCAWVDNITLPNGASNVKIIRKNNINIYPNPAKNIINISSLDDILNVTIFNAQGQIVKQVSNLGNQSIDISNLKKGMYFVKIQTKSTYITKKILKN